MLGVRPFGALRRRTLLCLFNVDVYLRNGLREAARVGAEFEAAEASHVRAACLVAPHMAYLALEGVGAVLAGISLARAFITVHPVMHLRMARHRFERLAAGRCLRRASADTGGEHAR